MEAPPEPYRLVVLYTADTIVAFGSEAAVQEQILASQDDLNLALANSGLAAYEVRVVSIAPAPAPLDTLAAKCNLGADLAALARPDIDKVQREQLASGIALTVRCGEANGLANRPSKDKDFRNLSSGHLVFVLGAFSQHTLAHEWGHTMGLLHDLPHLKTGEKTSYPAADGCLIGPRGCLTALPSRPTRGTVMSLATQTFPVFSSLGTFDGLVVGDPKIANAAALIRRNWNLALGRAHR
ncbi:MAG TPA: hypothetical protein VIE43_16510 [Thermoanaerobaculia bacterium]|nr:hypothetical protein [Thermoanaerobaculia bacterium]